jgi:hypothetical protein
VNELPLPNPKPRWSFPVKEATHIPQLFKEANLPDRLIKNLLNPSNQTKEGGTIHLFPSTGDLEAMTAAQRTIIYRELAKSPVNKFHAEPIMITADTTDEWFKTSKLRPDLIAKIKAMTYPIGDCIAFSDVAALMSYARTESEARLLYKALTRTRSLMVSLELKNESDLKPIIDYWTLGKGMRLKDVEPILQSILDTEGVERLSLTHILPPLPRKLRYTYPSQEFLRERAQPDCHWTSLNFFNYSEQNFLLNEQLATSAVIQNFTPVKKPYQYGDILFYLDSKQAFHSCTYLADDLVFTKNGRNPYLPWVIMKIDEVSKIYKRNTDTYIQGYRRNTLDDN